MSKLLSQSGGQTSVKGPGSFPRQKEAQERGEDGIQLFSLHGRPSLWSHKLGRASFLPSWCGNEVNPSLSILPATPPVSPGWQ